MGYITQVCSWQNAILQTLFPDLLTGWVAETWFLRLATCHGRWVCDKPQDLQYGKSNDQTHSIQTILIHTTSVNSIPKAHSFGASYSPLLIIVFDYSGSINFPMHWTMSVFEEIRSSMIWSFRICERALARKTNKCFQIEIFHHIKIVHVCISFFRITLFAWMFCKENVTMQRKPTEFLFLNKPPFKTYPFGGAMLPLSKTVVACKQLAILF